MLKSNIFFLSLLFASVAEGLGPSSLTNFIVGALIKSKSLFFQTH
jgi:hypothetical protein